MAKEPPSSFPFLSVDIRPFAREGVREYAARIIAIVLAK
jgi:hypothetical protein